MNFVPLMKPHRQMGRRPASLVRPDRPEARRPAQPSPAGQLRTGRGTGSARETWFFLPTARKSLIIEKSTATSHRSFATSRRRFAMSPFSGHRRVPYFSLLSKLLKEKKKEGLERKASEETGVPRVDPDLPSIGEAAYFLGHASHESAGGDSWQLMAAHPFEISHLAVRRMPPTSPRVALRVVRRSAPRRAG
ncbi:hypothetical protein [Paraburkholderia domus]|uniref:Uncharacterized protein n=1 Tax=Paraburkholderia domus TaxID=2793075 RepID=A0A9N8MJ46_9BURK|nr:hypothetical protein [Paraburkholderia domus]CAE6856397.1 hypothetical protein R70211_00187 [Paraburkholderia domus]